MADVTLRFYAELNDFLAPALRRRAFAHACNRRTSVKDMIESFGVPHTEVDLILVNGKSVDFSYIVGAGDRISVYPVFEGMDIGPVTRLRPEPLRTPRFIVDVNLGRLARYLRLLGFDCSYDNHLDDAEVARISAGESRTVLTRDRALLQQKVITHGCFVRADQPREQVREALARLDLYRLVRPFTRCTRCNGLLQRVDKQVIETELQPKTRRYYSEFQRCSRCGQIYWKGSHITRAERLVAVLGRPPEVAARWEHFPHGADIGVRGFGATREQAFEQAAVAMTAVITDPERIAGSGRVEIGCQAPDDDLLLADWLNALVYEMATRKWLFGRFEVCIHGQLLTAQAWGEPVDGARHCPAVEVKGATYTALRVAQETGGTWVAQCVVDV